MCEQNSDRLLELGQFLEDRRRLNQLPVCLRLLYLEKDKDRNKGGLLMRYGALKELWSL